MKTDPPHSHLISIRSDLRLHVLEWPGPRRPFVLLHGLASNARTWGAVAHRLQAAGHAVYAVDQRGHGRSDKPAAPYDFATVAQDLALLCDALALKSPIVAGQSWGGNVVLEFGVRHPQAAAGLVLVDGGFLDLQSRPGMTWEQVAAELRPPPLTGTPRAELRGRLQAWHPDWSEEGIDATLDNFELLADGTLRPWLTLDRHMQILRSLWDQRPPQLYAQVQAPVLVAAAEDGGNAEWSAAKRRQVETAAAQLAEVEVHWFGATAHDIHVHRPEALADLMLAWEARR
jgi:pimeloyl-ACP methyl ester carboxylesterase